MDPSRVGTRLARNVRTKLSRWRARGRETETGGRTMLGHQQGRREHKTKWNRTKKQMAKRDILKKIVIVEGQPRRNDRGMVEQFACQLLLISSRSQLIVDYGKNHRKSQIGEICTVCNNKWSLILVIRDFWIASSSPGSRMPLTVVILSSLAKGKGRGANFKNGKLWEGRGQDP